MKHNQCPKAQNVLQTEAASEEETFCQSPEGPGMPLIKLFCTPLKPSLLSLFLFS